MAVSVPEAVHRNQRAGRGRCLVCASTQKSAIESAMAGGLSSRDTERRFGIARSSLLRHAKNHRNPGLAVLAARPSEAVVQPDDLVERVEQKLKAIDAVLQAATASGNGPAMLAAVREARLTLGLLSKVTATNGQPVVVDLLATAQWRQILAAHLKVFDRNPGELVTRAQVRQELADAIQELARRREVEE